MKPVVRIYDVGDDELVKLRIKSDLSFEDTIAYLTYAIADLTKLDFNVITGFIMHMGIVAKEKEKNEKWGN